MADGWREDGGWRGGRAAGVGALLSSRPWQQDDGSGATMAERTTWTVGRTEAAAAGGMVAADSEKPLARCRPEKPPLVASRHWLDE